MNCFGAHSAACSKDIPFNSKYSRNIHDTLDAITAPWRSWIMSFSVMTVITVTLNVHIHMRMHPISDVLYWMLCCIRTVRFAIAFPVSGWSQGFAYVPHTCSTGKKSGELAGQGNMSTSRRTCWIAVWGRVWSCSNNPFEQRVQWLFWCNLCHCVLNDREGGPVTIGNPSHTTMLVVDSVGWRRIELTCKASLSLLNPCTSSTDTDEEGFLLSSRPWRAQSSILPWNGH